MTHLRPLLNVQVNDPGMMYDHEHALGNGIGEYYSQECSFPTRCCLSSSYQPSALVQAEAACFSEAVVVNS
jgi:hypothetical protein